jgi:hypothetical protein
MSEFEWVMLFAWTVMLFMYWRANRRASFLAHCLIAVGKGEMKVLVNAQERTYTLEKVDQSISRV